MDTLTLLRTVEVRYRNRPDRNRVLPLPDHGGDDFLDLLHRCLRSRHYFVVRKQDRGGRTVFEVT